MYINAKNVELTTSLTSNNALITGLAGATRTGTSKNDLFNSISGDTLVGGVGDDTYNLWDTKSTIVEKSGEGIDTVNVNFWGGIALQANVENVVLKSAGATWATGNALNNLIVAGVAGATLDGGAGDDVLVGGVGADIFKVRAGNGSDAIYNFKPGWDAIKLDGYGISSFAQVKSAATQVGSDVSIKLSATESLVLRGVQLNALTATDFSMAAPVAAPAASTHVLTTVGAGSTAHGWYVVNNAWGSTGLTAGKDFTLTAAFNDANYTKGTTFNWSYPVVSDIAPKILAFPEVIFGSSPLNTTGGTSTDTAHVFPVKVGDLVGLTAKYDVSMAGQLSGFDVAYDIWFSKSPTATGISAVSNEVMIWTHKGAVVPFGTVVGTYTKGDFTATIYHTGTYTAFVADKDVPAATIDVADMLAKLKSLGIMTDAEYLRSVELGAEVVSGSGSLTINDLNLTVATKTAAGGTVTKTVTGATTTVVDTPPPAAATVAAVVPPAAAKSAAVASSVAVAAAESAATTTTADKATTTTMTKLDTDGKLIGSDVVTKDAAITTTKHYDANGAYLGIDKATVTAPSTVSTEHYDAAGKFTGVDKTVTTTGTVSTEHYSNTYAFLGIDKVINNADGTVSYQHFGTDFKMTSADVVSRSGGSSTTWHYNGQWQQQGYDTATTAANGVVTALNYDAAKKLVSTTLTGTDHADTLTGSAGTTHLYGGRGSDTLVGGSGLDYFHFNSAIGQGDVDKISNFTAAKDKIVLDHAVFDQLGKTGALDASMFVTGTKALDASDHIIFDRAKGDLYYDADGNGAHAPILLAHFASDTALTSADFVIG